MFRQVYSPKLKVLSESLNISSMFISYISHTHTISRDVHNYQNITYVHTCYMSASQNYSIILGAIKAMEVLPTGDQ